MGTPRIQFEVEDKGELVAAQLTAALSSRSATMRERQLPTKRRATDRADAVFSRGDDARASFELIKGIIQTQKMKGRVLLYECNHEEFTGEPNRPCVVIDSFGDLEVDQ